MNDYFNLHFKLQTKKFPPLKCHKSFNHFIMKILSKNLYIFSNKSQIVFGITKKLFLCIETWRLLRLNDCLQRITF